MKKEKFQEYVMNDKDIDSENFHIEEIDGKIMCNICGQWDWLMYQESFRGLHSECKLLKKEKK